MVYYQSLSRIKIHSLASLSRHKIISIFAHLMIDNGTLSKCGLLSYYNFFAKKMTRNCLTYHLEYLLIVQRSVENIEIILESSKVSFRPWWFTYPVCSIFHVRGRAKESTNPNLVDHRTARKSCPKKSGIQIMVYSQSLILSGQQKKSQFSQYQVW